MRRATIILLRGFLLLYLGVCATLFFFQRSFLYHPQSATASGSTNLVLTTKDARVLVTTREHPGPHALIYFGGNAEDVSYYLPSLADAFPDHAVYLLNYRGFGGSTGGPSESALFADALTLYDKVRDEHPQVAIVGRSLGSGIAVYVASLRPVARLILVTPYDSIEDLAARQFPYVPVRWLLLDKYQSWKYAPKVTAPTLIIAAEHDQVVPRASTELLLTRFKTGVASLKTLPGTDHNDIAENGDYLRLIKDSLFGPQ